MQGAQRPAEHVACAADAEYRDCSFRSAERRASRRAYKGIQIAVAPECSLTPRSSRAPTAGHQARDTGTRYIFCIPGLASHRRCRLNSNVRPHKRRDRGFAKSSGLGATANSSRWFPGGVPRVQQRSARLLQSRILVAKSKASQRRQRRRLAPSWRSQRSPVWWPRLSQPAGAAPGFSGSWPPSRFKRPATRRLGSVQGP